LERSSGRRNSVASQPSTREKESTQDALAVKDRRFCWCNQQKEKSMLLLPYWIMGGAVVGWLTGTVMASEGRDYVMDIVMGIAGAVGGAFLFSAARILVQGNMIYTSLAAIVGAVILTGLTRYLGGRREYGATD
jgi:uncharacterized membrane protein YeaQ/YmgE (transglycosylase-associated protein family)